MGCVEVWPTSTSVRACVCARARVRVCVCLRVFACVCVCLRVRLRARVCASVRGRRKGTRAHPMAECAARHAPAARFAVVVVCKVAEGDAGPAPAPTAGLVSAAPSVVAATAAASAARAPAPAVRAGGSTAPAQRTETVVGRQGVGLPFRDGCLSRTAQLCRDTHTQTGATRQQGAARAAALARVGGRGVGRGRPALAGLRPGGEQPHGPESQGVANTGRPSGVGMYDY